MQQQITIAISISSAPRCHGYSFMISQSVRLLSKEVREAIKHAWHSATNAEEAQLGQRRVLPLLQSNLQDLVSLHCLCDEEVCLRRKRKKHIASMQLGC